MQYDVYPNPSPKSRDQYPYLVDIQSDLLSALATRMLVPLASHDMNQAAIPQRLCPTVPVAGKGYVLLPHQAAPLLKIQLKKRVDNARDHAHAIVDAMDAVIRGF